MLGFMAHEELVLEEPQTQSKTQPTGRDNETQTRRAVCIDPSLQCEQKELFGVGSFGSVLST